MVYILIVLRHNLYCFHIKTTFYKTVNFMAKNNYKIVLKI